MGKSHLLDEFPSLWTVIRDSGYFNKLRVVVPDKNANSIHCLLGRPRRLPTFLSFKCKKYGYYLQERAPRCGPFIFPRQVLFTILSPLFLIKTNSGHLPK